MCCLVEQEIPRKSRKAYSGGFLQGYHPKKLQKIAEEYLGKTPPGIVHGKLVNIGEYFAIDDKRAVLISATDVASEFPVLAREWKNNTRFISSLSDMFMHPAYQRIMSMGKPALPFILRDLQQNSGHWFYALRYIVGKDIAAGTTSVADARDAWLAWGYKNGYI